MSFGNNRKTSFLNSIPITSLDDDKNNLAKRCKFNFSYFDNSQISGQDFKDWNHVQLIKLLNKLCDYNKETLDFWSKQPIGSGKKRGQVLAVYREFPNNSDFKHPKHVPHQALWARFRLESDSRLIGFVVPEEYNNKEHNGTGFYFCTNTFYVVFLDEKHKFYKTKK